MAERNLSIRLSVRDGEAAKRALQDVGTTGQAALQRITAAGQPAARSLLALNEVGAAAQGVLSDFAGRAGVVGSALTALGPAGLAAGASIGALAAALGSGLVQLADSERRFLRLEAVLKATGHASGLTAGQIDALAEDLEESTMASAEAVLDTAGVLATFKSVSGAAFERTIRLSADMAAVFGQDLSASAMQLGKALEDPVEGLSALRRVGVSFTQSQRDMIAAMVEMGDTAGAQKLILDALETQVGGAGQAESKGLAGATKHLTDAWEDLLKAMARSSAIGGAAQAVVSGAEATLRDLAGLIEGPSLDEKLEAASRRADELRERLEAGRASNASPRWIAEHEAAHKAALERVYDLQRQLLDQVAADNAEQARAEAGRRQAQADATAEVIRGIEKKLQADLSKSATDAEEKKAAVRKALADDVARYEALRGKDGADDAAIDRLIADRQELAQRQIEEVEKPIREQEARERVAQERETQRQLDAIRHDGARVTEATRTPMEKYNAEVERLERLLAAGAISQDTFNRAVADAAGHLDQADAHVKAYLDSLGEMDREAARIWDATRTPIEQLERQMERLQTLWSAGKLDDETFDRAAAQAVDTYTAALDRAEGKTKDLGEANRDLSRAIGTAFEDAILSGEELGDVLEGLFQDVERIILRAMVTKPLEGMMTNLLSGLSVGGFGFGFANGGIMTSAGPLPLKAYASGGIADSPQLAVFGEGRMPEAYVPLPDGRSIPVSVKDDRRGGQRPIVINMNVNATDAGSFRRSEAQIGAEIAARLQQHLRRNG